MLKYSVNTPVRLTRRTSWFKSKSETCFITSSGIYFTPSLFSFYNYYLLLLVNQYFYSEIQGSYYLQLWYMSGSYSIQNRFNLNRLYSE